MLAIIEYLLLKNSNFVDSDYYLSTYKDVQEAHGDPLLHYLRFGWKEGRFPSKLMQVLKNDPFYLPFLNDNIPPLIQTIVLNEYLQRSKVDLLTPGGEAKINIPYGQLAYKMRFFDFVLLIKKIKSTLLNEGVRTLFFKTRRKLSKIGASKTIENYSVKYDVSIIVPVFNALAFTKQCLDKLFNTATNLSYEVIVVDNHSKDGTATYFRKLLRKAKILSYFRMATNLGFGGAVNYGMQKAKGKYVVILNNDTLVTPYWLDRMIQTFNADPQIAIVSPVTNYVGEGPQIDDEAIGISPNDIDEYSLKLKEKGFVYEPNRLVFFCVAIRREIILTIGYLDPRYEKGNYEDDDYCLRVILAGYKLAIASSSFVFHHGSVTFAKNKIDHQNTMEKNRGQFFTKAQELSCFLKEPVHSDKLPEISVIIRTADRPQNLRKALQSLTNQTYKRFEVVLVNDGEEKVDEVVSEYTPYFPITFIQHTQKRGRTLSLNDGINNSSSNWISILDDDDILYPWHFDLLHFYTIKNSAEKFFYSNTNYAIFKSLNSDYSSAVFGMDPWQFNKEGLLIANHIPINSWLVHRDCFDMVGLFDPDFSMLEDFEFLMRLSRTINFHHIDRVSSEYRYFVEGMNSMLLHRNDIYESLLKIYNKITTDDETIKKRRESELDSLRILNTKLDYLKQEINWSTGFDLDKKFKLIFFLLGKQYESTN